MNQPVKMLVVENFGSCNMHCTYCFPEHMWRREGFKGVMSEDLYRGTLERVFASSDSEEIDVHLAGGEPLLAGRSWFQMAFNVGRQVAHAYGKRVTFSLQTNATLATPEFAKFLAENEVNIGVSLDGDEKINEAVRGQTDRVLAGFHNLADAFGRPPAVIVTVTKCNARNMPQVISFLDRLEVTLFRANQMGATATWNAHHAPTAEDWLIARKDIFTELASRNGRILEKNLADAVAKFVNTLLDEVEAFNTGMGCCDMRCGAGRNLMYFDQKGNAYPCPRANITPEARIANVSDANFQTRWDEASRQLDSAMEIPELCGKCPAQFICDYGCHAFNHAQFFEVNCDATKDFFAWAAGTRLEDLTRLYYYVAWRDGLKSASERNMLRQGTTVPNDFVQGLSAELRVRLGRRLARETIDLDLLRTRYGQRAN